MTLHTVGPVDMTDDERRIGAGYHSKFGQTMAILPIVVACFADLKWVVGVGFAIVIPIVHECGGRLHDLCIRGRRTNILLSERTSA